MLSALGKILEETSALRVTVSVAASPKVKFPEIVALPVTVIFPPTVTLPVVVIASIYPCDQ